MTGQCCVRGPASSRLARRFFTMAGTMLPPALLIFTPKCPMCLAAWLTVATGIGFSAPAVAWVRATLVILSVALAAVAIAAIVRRRPYHRGA